MVDDKFEVIKKLKSLPEAEVIKGLLESHGIKTFIDHKNINTMEAGIFGIRVKVYKQEAHKAKEVIRQSQIQVFENEPFACPLCGQTNTDILPVKRNILCRILNGLFSNQQKLLCNSCKHVWKQKS